MSKKFRGFHANLHFKCSYMFKLILKTSQNSAEYSTYSLAGWLLHILSLLGGAVEVTFMAITNKWYDITPINYAVISIYLLYISTIVVYDPLWIYDNPYNQYPLTGFCTSLRSAVSLRSFAPQVSSQIRPGRRGTWGVPCYDRVTTLLSPIFWNITYPLVN